MVIGTDIRKLSKGRFTMNILVEMPVGDYYKHRQVQYSKQYYMVEAGPGEVTDTDAFKTVVFHALNMTLTNGLRSADYKSNSATALRLVLCNLMRALGFVSVNWREAIESEIPDFFVYYVNKDCGGLIYTSWEIS